MDVASLRVKVVNEGMDAATKGLDEVTKSADKAEKSVGKLEKAEKKIKKFNDNLSGLRNAALGMGAALGGVLYKSIGAAQEFESAMAEVKKTVDFESPKGIEDMRKGLEKLTTQIPQTFGELAATASNAGLLGVAEKDILGFTETVAKMGVAFDLQSDAVAESMAKIANVFQIPIKDIGNLGDVINHLSNNMASTAGEIIDFTKRTASLSATMGLSEDSTAAFGSAMIALGMPAEVAGTAFNAFLGKLANLDGLSKRGKAAFASMGLDATEFAKLMQNDAEAGILKFIETLKGVPKKMQAALAYDALGSELAPKVLAMAAGYEEVARALEMTGDAAGSMEKEFAAISDTSANKMVLFKNNIDLVWSSIGDALIPAFNDLLDAMRPFIESMTNWVRENPALVQGIIIVTGAISGLLLGITGLGLAFAGAISMATGFQAIGAALAPVFAGLSLPIMGVVAAIAAVIAIGVALYKNWDTVKEKAGQLGGYLSSEFGGVKDTMSDMADEVKGVFSSLSQSAMPAMQAVSDVFKGTFDSFKEIASGALQIVVSIVKSNFMGIVTTVSSVLQIALTVFKAGFDLMKNAVMTVMKIIVAIIDGDFKAIPKIMGDGISQGVAIVGNALGKIVDVIKDYGKRMFNLGKDFIQGFINGIKSIGSGVIGAASTMASNAVAAVRRAQDSRSPSKKTLKLGKDFGKGFANGIKASKKPVVTEAQKMAEQAVETVKNSIASLKKEIALFGNDSPLASFQYDVSVGKYAGVPQSMLEQNAELIRQKQQLIKLDKEAKDAADALAKEQQRIAQANQSVLDSVAGINRQIALFNGNDALSGLMYDIENTGKYADVSAENMQKLIDKTKELQLLKDTQAANDAFYNMTDSMQEDSPMGRLIAERDERLAILAEANRYEIGMAQERTNALLAIEQSFMDKKRDLLLTQSQNLFSGLSGLAKSFAGEQSGIYRTLFAIEKGFAVAQSAIAIQQSIAKAMAVGFPQNLPLIGQAVSQGGQIMSAIRSVTMPIGQAHDGIMSVPKSGTWNLEKGERVLPAHTAKAMDRKLEAVNDAPNVNITVNVDANGNAQMDAKQADTMSRSMANSIKTVVIDTIRKEKRQGGMLYA